MDIILCQIKAAFFEAKAVLGWKEISTDLVGRVFVHLTFRLLSNSSAPARALCICILSHPMIPQGRHPSPGTDDSQRRERRGRCTGALAARSLSAWGAELPAVPSSLFPTITLSAPPSGSLCHPGGRVVRKHGHP